MMRCALLSILLLSLCGCSGMEYMKRANPFQFTHYAFQSVPDTPQGDLFERAMAHMARFYVSSSDVIQYASEDRGRIVGRAVMDVVVNDGFVSIPARYYYTIDMAVRDNQYAMYIDGFIRDVDGVRMPAAYVNEVAPIATEVEKIKAQFEVAMTKPRRPLQ